MFVIEAQKERGMNWHQVYQGQTKKHAQKKFDAIDEAITSGQIKPIRIRLAEQTVCGLSVMAIRG